MKSYLMTGIAALTLCAGFTSCSHDDFEPMSQAEIDKAKYDMAFLNYVGGKIDKNQDWGFGTSTTKGLTRGSNAGDGTIGNQTWAQFNADELVNIENAERIAVLEAIAAKVTGEKISEDIVFPWENYYLQDVVNYTSDYSGDEFANAGKKGMSDVSVSNLEAFAKGSDCSPYYHHGDDYANYVEVTNSKQMNQYFQKETASGQERIDKTTLMVDMEVGTYDEMKGRQFRVYQNCHIDGHYDDYITVQVNGNWYICFDFGCGDAEHDVDGQPGRGATYNDWDYNDWIIKITEAVPHNGTNTPVWDGTPEEGEGEGDGDTDTEEEVYDLRIIAEDLSASAGTDFDFNDVVFDVKYGSPVTIKILAAGGTLPLYINGQEVHGLFNAEITEMVNTNANGGVERDPVVLPLEGVSVTTPEEANKNIVITVEKNGVLQTLTAEKGEAACKIAVDTDFQWLDERVSIKDTYENFVNWVNGSFTGKWW